MTLSYCYLPDDYEGHRPANREEIERVGRGAVYSWPSATTIHMDLMRRTRATLDDAHNDGVLDEATHQEEEFVPPAPEHRVGCSHSRTGKCICTYLAQWDNHEEKDTVRLRLFTEQMADEGRVITIDTLNGTTSEWDGVFTPRDIEGNPLAADTARLHNTELSLTFWKGQAKHWQKGYWIMAPLAAAGWGLAVARGIWGF